MWLGKVVNLVDLGGACKKRYVGKAQHIKGTRYDGGDWRVAVVWYERTGDDDERFTFREPPSDADVDYFNSTELHLIMLGGGKALRRRCRGGNGGRRKGLVVCRGFGPAIILRFALVIFPPKNG